MVECDASLPPAADLTGLENPEFHLQRIHMNAKVLVGLL